MADRGLLDPALLTAIADAIRAKNGSASGYTPAQMAQAIAALSAASELADDPAYFYAETADTITKLSRLRKPGTLLVMFLTDSHLYTSSGNAQYFDVQAAALNAVCRAIPPDLVVHGGDMTNGSEAKDVTLAEADHVVKTMREIGGDDTLILIGNHDGNTVQPDSAANEARRITEAEMRLLWRAWDDGFTYAGDGYTGGQFYGYRDYDALGLRVIRLHSYIERIGVDGCYGGQGGNWGYYPDEVAWFRTVALNTPHDVLILSHQSLSPVLQGYDEAQDIPHRGTQMQQALDAWIANGGRCAGVIHGHVHWDYAAKGKGTFQVIDHSSKNLVQRTGSYGDFYEFGLGLANYLPSFSAADARPVSSYRDVPKDAVAYGRASGAPTQGLWTAAVVDPSAGTIDLIRFGAGEDVRVNYGSTDVSVTGVTLSESAATLTEGDTLTLAATVTPSDATNPSVTWSSSDPTVATVSGGTVTAVSAGAVTITVTTADGGFTASCAITVEALPKVNLLPLATDASGNAYNGGAGYKAGYRLNSAGAETAMAGKYVTGFIPVRQGQKVMLENIQANTAAQDNNYIAFYDSSKTLLAGYSRYVYAWYNQSGDAVKPATADASGYLTSFTLTGASGSYNYDFTNAAYFRLAANLIDATSAVYVE